MGCAECIPTKPFALTRAAAGCKPVQALRHAEEDNVQKVVSQQEIIKVGAVAKVSASGRAGTVVAVDPRDELIHCKLDFHDGEIPAVDWFSKEAVTVYDWRWAPQELAQQGTSQEAGLSQETNMQVTVPTSDTDGRCGKPSNERGASTVSHTSETSARLDASALLSLDALGQTQSRFSGSISSISEGARSLVALNTDQLVVPLTRFPSKASMCSANLARSQGAHATELAQLGEELDKLSRRASQQSHNGGPLTRFPSMCSAKQLEEELTKLSRRVSQQSQIESDLGRLCASQVGECQRIEHELQEARTLAVQKLRQEAELERIKVEAMQTAKLQAELQRAQAEAEEYKRKLESELRSLKCENEKSRAEHSNMVQQVHKRLEQERESANLIRQRDRLLEQERNTHDMQVLQERVNEHSAEANALRQRAVHLKQQLEEAESQNGNTLQQQDKVRQELDEAVKAQDALRKVRDELEQKLKEATRRRQPTCGFSVASGERQPQCQSCTMM